jgi:hypothetical protein
MTGGLDVGRRMRAAEFGSADVLHAQTSQSHAPMGPLFQGAVSESEACGTACKAWIVNRSSTHVTIIDDSSISLLPRLLFARFSNTLCSPPPGERGCGAGRTSPGACTARHAAITSQETRAPSNLYATTQHNGDSHLEPGRREAASST